MMNLYTPYSAFLSRFFVKKVQKLPVDVGFTCPVRDGSISKGGCSFCNGRSFVPDLCNPDHGIVRQLEQGKEFFRRKHSKNISVEFLAYFQAGSNTYSSIAEASAYFEEAMSVPDVIGLVIATRPDCLSDEWYDYLKSLSHRFFVMIELGIESVNEETLVRVGRGHTFQTACDAVWRLAALKIPIGVHMILGLPGEDRSTMLLQAKLLSTLPVDVLKLHQLQILKGARMENEYLTSPEKFHLFTPDEYVGLVADYLELLNPAIVVERFVSQSPGSSLIAPRWGLKNDVITHRIISELKNRSSWQGKYCHL